MKTLRIMMILLVGIVGLSEIVTADDISSYYSLHNIPKNNYYCSATPSSESSYGLCYQPTPYYHSESLTGVRNQYDIFSSPKQICHKDSGSCSLPSLWNPGGSVDPYSAFRIFVPPGTTYFFVEIYMPRDAWIAAAARMGKPPESSAYQYPSYLDIPQPTTGTLIDDYRNTDIITKNGGGHTTVIAASADSVIGFSGGWFYVKILNYGGGDITNIKYGTNILTSRLKTWWDMVTDPEWANLENGYFGEITLPTYRNCTSSTNPPQYCPSGYGTNASCSTDCKDYITCPISTPNCSKPKETGSSWCEQGACSSCPQCSTVDCTQCNSALCLNPACPQCPVTSCSQCNAADCKSPACPTCPELATPVQSGTIFGGSGSNSSVNIPVRISTMGAFTEKQVSISTVAGSKIVPQLTFDNLPAGRYDMYAAILQNGVLYVAVKDIADQIVFVEWREGLAAISYETRESTAIQSPWTLNFYPYLKAPVPNYQNVHIYVGIAPENDFNKYQAADISFY